MSEGKKTKFCSNCGAEIDIKAKICPKCGVEQPVIPEKVSNWWYICPIFLGIIGGLVAWVFNKDRNPKKAKHFLVVGIVVFVIWFLIGFAMGLLGLGGGERAKEDRETAREMAGDSRIISGMNQIRNIIYSNEGDYNDINCTHPQIAPICQRIKTEIGAEPTIYSSQKKFCAYTKLHSGDYWCIGIYVSGKTSIYPGKTGYCDGRTFICP